MMNLLVWRIAAILLLSILGAVSSSAPGAGGESEGAPMIIETIRYTNGDTYVGELKDGKRNGEGIYKWADGDVYDGKWENSKRHGEGRMKYNDGNEYSGAWNSGKFHGKGIIKWANGDVYYGEFKDGQLHGKGIHKWANGDTYVGELNGKGTYEWANGDTYVGELNGKGTYEWANGDVYDGEWLAGEPHGEGKMKYNDGSEYSGKWHSEKFHGKGTYKSANGHVYDGEFEDNERHGEGKMKYNDGSEYDGMWVKGKRHGRGTQTRMWNIYRYQGEWSNDKMHGKGTVAWFWSFVECEGEWNNDELRGNPICRSVLLQRLVEVTWHYLVEHYLDLVAVLGVWICLRQLADVKATLPKLQCDKEKFEAYMKEKLKRDATGEDEELIVGLDQDHIQCGICHEDFTTDMQSTDQTTRDMLPVLGSCGHYFCHGCIIRCGSNCPKCMRANQFVPGSPTHHRMLIDLLQRARPVEN